MILPSCSTASSAAIRPLIVADTMLRTGNPDTVAASNLYGACPSAGTHSAAPANSTVTVQKIRADAFMFTILFDASDFSWTILSTVIPGKRFFAQREPALSEVERSLGEPREVARFFAPQQSRVSSLP